MTMADRIVVLREGIVEQAGSPIELYARPGNQFVAGFLGAPQMNFIQGKVSRRDGELGLKLGDGVTVGLPGRSLELSDGAAVTVGIRPEHAEIGNGPFTARIEVTEILGSETIIHARLQSGQAFTLARRGISAAKAGDDISLSLPPPFIHLFDDKGIAVGATPDWRSDYVR